MMDGIQGVNAMTLLMIMTGLRNLANLCCIQNGEHPDHLVVIKYIPAVGDSKRAMDEYVSEIFMGYGLYQSV